MNLFSDTSNRLGPEDLEMGQLLASIATIGIISHRTIRQKELLAEQLQTALNSRIVIEQAKGVIAERAGVDMGTAFATIRAAARRSRRPLSDVAIDIAEGRLSPELTAQLANPNSVAEGVAGAARDDTSAQPRGPKPRA